MKENNTNHFEAIVIGAGMTGGWAAKELCDNGVDTLLIERGRNVEHIKDYPTSNMLPWEFKHRGQINQNTLKETNNFKLLINHLSDLDGLPDDLIELGKKQAEAEYIKNGWLFKSRREN